TKKWMEYLPFVYLSLYVKKEDCKIENSVHYGYGVNTIYKDLVKNLFTPCTRIIPSRLSLHTVVKTNGGFSLEMEDCEYIKKYIKETGLNISGDIIGWIINEEI
ncbi:MAG TPA: hypothetical protein DHN33_10265, partial [Eubacteriaceae bacterium]|nr:hypothetical protein [Eubacteriaceae bacterium]